MLKREQREQREQQIIRQTIVQLGDGGFLALRMSDVARASRLSMGTIYSHFESKEDLLLACAIHICRAYRHMFANIFPQPLPAGEKLVTCLLIYWLLDRHFPIFAEIMNLSRMPSLWQRATRQRCEASNLLHRQIASEFEALVRQCIPQDFSPPPDIADCQDDPAFMLHHGLWALCVGSESTGNSGYFRMLTHTDDNRIQDDSPYRHFRHIAICFLRGYGWQKHEPETFFDRCRERAEHMVATFHL